MVCINAAHQDASGLDAAHIRGAALGEFLPGDEAECTGQLYADCADADTDMRFYESLTLPSGVMHWDTCLQHVPLENGGSRVVGTTFQVLQQTDQDESRLVFDDIRFFSALADMQLQNLVSMFDAARKSELFCANSADRVAQLGSICRGVQKAVNDIQNIARQAGDKKAGKTCDTRSDSADAALGETGETVRALVDSCAS
ncbi:hypothetical protein [uncultured Roseobacter sp.]|uniref:hypothetical protein n=1 Tax=uncultured Roseobacter sp. TaxID=114847 RepID=UPI00261E7BA9|nr:hypothetical protein [uncultured Roseobacter sp.]